MKLFAALACATLAPAAADFAMHPYDPLPVTTTSQEIIADEARTTTRVMYPQDPLVTTSRRHPFDPLPPTGTTSMFSNSESTSTQVDSKCADCLDRQSSGENVSCASVCGLMKKTTTKVNSQATEGELGAEGDVCYEFCETTGEATTKKCVEGLTCTAWEGIGFDSCGERASTCQFDTTYDEPGEEGDVCFQFCEDGSRPTIDRECAKGYECMGAGGSGTSWESPDACGDGASTCQPHDMSACYGDSGTSKCESWQTCSCSWWTCGCQDLKI